MSNFRLFCCTFTWVSLCNAVAKFIGLTNDTPNQSFILAVVAGFIVVAVAGDQSARKIVEGR